MVDKGWVSDWIMWSNGHIIDHFSLKSQLFHIIISNVVFKPQNVVT